MLRLRKIPLYPLIEILQDLYESGADYIDLSGEQNEEGDSPKDLIQITIKPEYMLQDNREENATQEIDYSDEEETPNIKKTLSEDDLNELL